MTDTDKKAIIVAMAFLGIIISLIICTIINDFEKHQTKEIKYETLSPL